MSRRQRAPEEVRTGVAGIPCAEVIGSEGGVEAVIPLKHALVLGQVDGSICAREMVGGVIVGGAIKKIGACENGGVGGIGVQRLGMVAFGIAVKGAYIKCLLMDDTTGKEGGHSEAKDRGGEQFS